MTEKQDAMELLEQYRSAALNEKRFRFMIDHIVLLHFATIGEFDGDDLAIRAVGAAISRPQCGATVSIDKESFIAEIDKLMLELEKP